MSDALGEPLRPAPPSTASGEEDALNLLDGSAEPTDDSPTVISKGAQPQVAVAIDAAGGLRGRHLAHFELIEPIGVGGMAAVLRARDTQLDRLVALKILPPEMAADPENVRRFHQEARSAARLDHENIARVFFCGEDQRLHFIAFEFVEGDNLRTILEKRGRLPVGEALHYMLQVAAGLAHAARRGVVHRDIKPSNIIITPNGRAKLVDMGLARSLEPQHDMGLTQSGVTLGTFDYISPEQALEPRDADVRSDIYSLGCTFYHMLTGQPPVPEGTAAKKLHHHQHIKPPDPRQLVADLPDEVVVILDRMMAKQPKDRYQTPEHLVHHLYVAARKLGAAAEVPEGVLAVEAALPAPPSGRPLVLAALATIAVVALIFLIETSSTTKPEPAPNLPLLPTKPMARSDTTPVPATNPSPSEEKKDKSSAVLSLPKEEVPVFDMAKPTVEALTQFLRENEAKPKIVLALDDLDLSRRSKDLVIANPTVVLRARTAGMRPTIRDQYLAQPSQTFQASLTIRSRHCTVENIRFVLDQSVSNVPMALLRFEGTQEMHITGCEFIQIAPQGEQARMASVLAEAREPARLIVSRSCFLGFGIGTLDGEEGRSQWTFDKPGGQDALTRRGPVQVDVVDCLFGPHAAALRLEGSAGENAPVHLNHCSLLLGDASAVFDVAANADASLEARYSLFSRPTDFAGLDMTEGNEAVLLRRASAASGQVAYRGTDNRYHHLERLLVGDAGKETVAAMLDEMKKNDDKSRTLETSPWQEADPLQALKALDIKTAFAINPTARDLRVAVSKKTPIGSEYALSFSYLDKLPALKAETPPSTRQRIVQNRKTQDSEKRLYPTLNHALVEVQAGDVVRLQLNGEIKLNPYQLNNARLSDLTLKADPGFHPILTLDTEEQDGSEEEGALPALFKVYNGKLQLEGLEIRLRPRGGEEGCAVVSLVGEGSCVLKNCVVTLERGNAKARLAVVPQRRMKKPAAAASRRSHLSLENCFIRGHGDLLDVPGGASARVEIEKCLLALSGSLLNVEADKNEDRPAPVDPLELHLQNVTTYLGENVVRLQAAKSIKGLPKTNCLPTACLFLPAGDRSALVRLEGLESEENGLHEKLGWESAGKNAYGNFPALLEFQSLDSMKMPVSWNQEKWKNGFGGEMTNEYSAGLSNPPAPELSFARLSPLAFRPSDTWKAYGVDPRSLPTPQTNKIETPARLPAASEADFGDDAKP